jgi:hypothetical protein
MRILLLLILHFVPPSLPPSLPPHRVLFLLLFFVLFLPFFFYGVFLPLAGRYISRTTKLHDMGRAISFALDILILG